MFRCAVPERVVVAMSGGVDSSVAAALLQEQGYDVVGITLHLWDPEGAASLGRCCRPEDREDARTVAARLDIPHYVIDRREAFRTFVVDPFAAQYVLGRTPNPCVHCNREVKLGPLIDIARELGAERVATGHYARVDGDRLLRATDRGKDQSYFLFSVGARVLSRLILPLGSTTKAETRAAATRLGLHTFDKPDSQELCFVPDGGVGDFIAAQRVPHPPGNIVDPAGIVLGRHAGIAHFTVGQRRGVGLGGGGERRYVLRIIADTQTVVVGPEQDLFRTELTADDASWLVPPSEQPFEARVRIRSGHEPERARVTAHRSGFDCVFETPQRAITPGQAAVVYRDEQVLGGGFIV